MADQLISLKIPSDKVTIALQGFLKIYPNAETTGEENPTPKYTNKQWVTEKIRRIVARDIHRGLQVLQNEQNIVFTDDGVVTVV